MPGSVAIKTVPRGKEGMHWEQGTGSEKQLFPVACEGMVFIIVLLNSFVPVWGQLSLKTHPCEWAWVIRNPG